MNENMKMKYFSRKSWLLWMVWHGQDLEMWRSLLSINRFSVIYNKRSKFVSSSMDKTWLCIFHFGMELVMFYPVSTFVTIICFAEDCGVYCHMKQVVLNTGLNLIQTPSSMGNKYAWCIASYFSPNIHTTGANIFGCAANQDCEGSDSCIACHAIRHHTTLANQWC